MLGYFGKRCDVVNGGRGVGYSVQGTGNVKNKKFAGWCALLYRDTSGTPAELGAG